MIQCDGDRKCTYIGFNRQCLAATSYVCEHKRTVPDQEAGQVFEFPDLNSIKYAMPPSDLNRIADALEKIARELERGNKLKSATLRATIESDYLDEIMEG